jgi:hypothetical protein
MYSLVEFRINPKLDFDFEKVISLKNKNIDVLLKTKIIKDLLSNKFKKDLQDIIFNTISNDFNDLSQYLDGTINSINYNKSNSSITIKLKIFFSKSLPKQHSSLKKSVLLDNADRLKLLTKENIIELIKKNINHIYQARGHYKNYKLGDQTIYLDLSPNSNNDKYAMNGFIIS